MLENDRMEKSSTEVTSIWRRNDINKSTWRTHRYFVDFESRIDGEISTSNRCHNFHVESPFKIDVISTNFPRGNLELQIPTLQKKNKNRIAWIKTRRDILTT